MKNLLKVFDDHRSELEDEAVFVIREVAAHFEMKVILFPVGEE